MEEDFEMVLDENGENITPKLKQIKPKFKKIKPKPELEYININNKKYIVRTKQNIIRKADTREKIENVYNNGRLKEWTFDNYEKCVHG